MKAAPLLAIATTLFIAAGCATYTDTRAAADRALERNLRAEMKRYGDLAANAPHVRFRARDGTITLVGTVQTPREADMLSSMVRNTPGVVAVDNELRVLSPTGYPAISRVYAAPPVVTPAPVYSALPPSMPQGTIVVIPSAYPNFRMLSTAPGDEVVARRIGEQLATDRVSARALQDVNITVSGDTAYVQGTVDSASARQEIVSSVARAGGLKAVYDQLRVR